MKTKDWLSKMGQNEPENEPKKSFRFSACGKMNRKGPQNDLDPAENRIEPANEAENSPPVWLGWMLIRHLRLRAQSASRACGVMAPLNAA